MIMRVLAFVLLSLAGPALAGPAPEDWRPSTEQLMKELLNLQYKIARSGNDAQAGPVCGPQESKAATLYTIPFNDGIVVLPCEPAGMAHWMTPSTAARLIEAAGLSGVMRPLLARAADLDNPLINKDRARLGRSGTVLDQCLRSRSLLPAIPEVVTPLDDYLAEVRAGVRGREVSVSASARECLQAAPLFAPGTDWLEQ